MRFVLRDGLLTVSQILVGRPVAEPSCSCRSLLRRQRFQRLGQGSQQRCRGRNESCTPGYPARRLNSTIQTLTNRHGSFRIFPSGSAHSGNCRTFPSGRHDRRGCILRMAAEAGRVCSGRVADVCGRVRTCEVRTCADLCGLVRCGLVRTYSDL